MKEGFKIVVLGCKGGPKENNLSGYLLSPLKKSQWITFDAGTLLTGIEIAIEKKAFDDVSFADASLLPACEFLLTQIKGYCISHAHLDHIAALVINSPVDGNKEIYGINPTIDNLRDHIFNGRIWPNYGSEGLDPIKRYRYVRLPLHQSLPVFGTDMQIEAYLLSHPRGYPSTAFLIRHEEDYMLYFGDTSSDSMEIEKHLGRVWKRCAPLVREKKLKGIMLECSYSKKEVSQTAYGHLDPKLLMAEMKHLAEISGASVEGLNVIVTHRKENVKSTEDMIETIATELSDLNTLKLNLIFPQQGDRIVI